MLALVGLSRRRDRETSERKVAGQLHCSQSCSGVYLNKCVGTILDLEQ